MATRTRASQALGNGGRLAIRTNLPTIRSENPASPQHDRSPLGRKFNDENGGVSTRTEAIRNSNWRNNRRGQSETDTMGQPSLSEPSLAEQKQKKRQLSRLNTVMSDYQGVRRYRDSRDSPIDPDLINSASVTAEECYSCAGEEKHFQNTPGTPWSHASVVNVDNQLQVDVLSLDKIGPENGSSGNVQREAHMTIAPIQPSGDDNETMCYPVAELWPVIGGHDTLETQSWAEAKIEAQEITAEYNSLLQAIDRRGVRGSSASGANIIAMLEAIGDNDEELTRSNYNNGPMASVDRPAAMSDFRPDQQARYDALMNRLHESSIQHKPYETAPCNQVGRQSLLNPTAAEFYMKEQLVEPAKESEWLIIKRSISELQKTIDKFLARHHDEGSRFDYQTQRTRNWEPTQDMAGNGLGKQPTLDGPQSLPWNPPPYPLGLVPMMNNTGFNKAQQMPPAEAAEFTNFVPGQSAPPPTFVHNALFGPKPVRKPKPPCRSGDPQQVMRQQDYEAYLEYRRATDIKYAQACKARQMRRAERQRLGREKGDGIPVS